MIGRLNEYIEKVKEEWEQGRWKGYESLQNIFSFNNYVERVEELCFEKRKDSEPSLSVNLVFKKGFKIDEKKLLYWYLLSKAKRKAITLRYDLNFFKLEERKGVINKSRIAEMEFINQRGTYLIYRNHFTNFIEDLERKDPDPAKVFIRLIAGGVKLNEKKEEFSVCKRLADKLKMHAMKSRGGKEVKGGWFKPCSPKEINEFLYCVKELNGLDFIVEFRQIEYDKIPRLGNVLGVKLEYPAKYYSNYHIWLSDKGLNSYLSVYDKELDLLKEILVYLGMKETRSLDKGKVIH
jgi:hypothetical protein